MPRCDSLKIDSSFVQSMCDDENSLQIVKAIISLAEDLGKEVTAEGVETGVQAARLRGLGCQYGQGFLFSGPLPPQQVADYLKQCRGGSLAGEAPEPPRQPHAETTAPNMVP
jgi:EAL domain-containing protein (putative c-di-GMP-specific phosphodiesterase class I)